MSCGIDAWLKPVNSYSCLLLWTDILLRTIMTIQMTYTQVRDHLAQLLVRVTSDQEVVIIQRRGHEDVALLPADELSSMLETLHPLRPQQRQTSI